MNISFSLNCTPPHRCPRGPINAILGEHFQTRPFVANKQIEGIEKNGNVFSASKIDTKPNWNSVDEQKLIIFILANFVSLF